MTIKPEALAYLYNFWAVLVYENTKFSPVDIPVTYL